MRGRLAAATGAGHGCVGGGETFLCARSSLPAEMHTLAVEGTIAYEQSGLSSIAQDQSPRQVQEQKQDELDLHSSIQQMVRDQLREYHDEARRLRPEHRSGPFSQRARPLRGE